MPAVETRFVRRFSRAPEVFLVKRGGVVLNLTTFTSVKIELIEDRDEDSEEDKSTYYIRGTDAECTWFDDGVDGKLQYNPPVGGWLKDAQIVIWLETSEIFEDFPGDGELEFRVREVGDVDPVPAE